jgi:4-oxalmesaconate hydratase
VIIDSHGHLVAPPELYEFQATLLASRGYQGRRSPNIGDDRIQQYLDTLIDTMDSVGTDVQFISPRPYLLMHSQTPPRIVETFVVAANDLIADQVKRRPDRLRGVCALPQSPLRDPGTCVDELTRCVEELGFVGALLDPDPSEGTGTVPPLGDAYWYPLYARLEELDVPALIHSAGCNNGRESYSSHFITEESIAVLSLLESDVFARFPRLRLVVPHGGGSIPYQIGRWRAGRLRYRDTKESFDDALRRLYFDTVLYNRESLELLFRTCGTDRCLFGTEKPGSGSARDADGAWLDDLKPVIESIDWLTEDDRAAIFEGNARVVYPRAFT